MNLISRDELRTLAEVRNGGCISIYMPTHRAGAETQQDPIRLKNLLGQAESRLQALELQTSEIETLLAPAVELLSDQLFWQHQRDGLAIFLSPHVARIYRVPLKFEALVLTTERFHLKPLMPLLSADKRFYILTLSQDEIRLFQGTHYSIGEIELQDVPTGLTEFLSGKDRERHLQFHTSTRPSGGRGGERPAVFHGHGVVESHAQDDIARYFQRVDTGLQSLFGDETAPLVLVAVDQLLSMYQQVSSYPHLLDAGVKSHPDAISSLDELHARVWEIVEPHFVASQQEAAALYRQLAGTGDTRASHDVTEVVPAAYNKRVSTLFVALGTHKWGTFAPQTQIVEVHSERQPADEDLLDFAVVHTFLNRGTVYAVTPEKVPAEGPLAAVFRY